MLRLPPNVFPLILNLSLEHCWSILLKMHSQFAQYKELSVLGQVAGFGSICTIFNLMKQEIHVSMDQ